MTAVTDLRETRPDSFFGGGWTGSPTITWILAGRMKFLPFGIADSDPPMPTGTIGTPVRAATYTAPSFSGWVRGPLLRSPSGKRTVGSPAVM